MRKDGMAGIADDIEETVVMAALEKGKTRLDHHAALYRRDFVSVAVRAIREFHDPNDAECAAQMQGMFNALLESASLIFSVFTTPDVHEAVVDKFRALLVEKAEIAKALHLEKGWRELATEAELTPQEMCDLIRGCAISLHDMVTPKVAALLFAHHLELLGSIFRAVEALEAITGQSEAVGGRA